MSADRLKIALAGVVRSAMPSPPPYMVLYDGRVVAQSADLDTVDVIPVDLRVPSMGGVPLRGMPGIKVRLAINRGPVRVTVGWFGGNPSRPFAALFDAPSTIAELIVNASVKITLQGGTKGAARKGDAAKLTMSPAEVAELAAALLGTGAFTPSGSPPSPAPAPVLFAGGEITGGSTSVNIGG